MTTTPRSSRRARVAGTARAARVSAFALRMTSGGVLAVVGGGPDSEGHAGFGDRRQFGQRRRALRRGYPKCAQRPALDERHHRADVVEHHVDASGNEVLERGSGAAIGDVGHLDAGHALEELAGEMDRGAMS